MPPWQDVGRHPVDLICVFSVSDDGGKQLVGQKLAITVLPVDNQVFENLITVNGMETI